MCIGMCGFVCVCSWLMNFGGDRIMNGVVFDVCIDFIVVLKCDIVVWLIVIVLMLLLWVKLSMVVGCGLMNSVFVVLMLISW